MNLYNIGLKSTVFLCKRPLLPFVTHLLSEEPVFTQVFCWWYQVRESRFKACTTSPKAVCLPWAFLIIYIDKRYIDKLLLGNKLHTSIAHDPYHPLPLSDVRLNYPSVEEPIIGLPAWWATQKWHGGCRNGMSSSGTTLLSMQHHLVYSYNSNPKRHCCSPCPFWLSTYHWFLYFSVKL